MVARSEDQANEYQKEHSDLSFTFHTSVWSEKVCCAPRHQCEDVALTAVREAFVWKAIVCSKTDPLLTGDDALELIERRLDEL